MSTIDARWARPLVGSLPPGAEVALPGRGSTWVWDAAGPPGAPTLLLLHGWTSTAALNWYRCFEPLRQHFRVVAMDHRGHGRGIRSRRPFRLEECADDAAALIDTLDLGRVVAVGYSMGGPVAQQLWKRHPDVTAGLVLCATAARFARRRDLIALVQVVSLSSSLTLAALPGGIRAETFDRLLYRHEASHPLAPWARHEYSQSDLPALIQAGGALNRYDATRWIHEVDVPTAVVVTTEDETVRPERQWWLADAIPGATPFPVAANHRAVVEAADVFVPALLAACSQVATSSAA